MKDRTDVKKLGSVVDRITSGSVSVQGSEPVRTDRMPALIISQPDPGILRSVLAEIQTNPTAYCEQLNPNRTEKISGT